VTLTTEQIASVLELENDAGVVTPDAVIEAARNRSNPLHELFEWDKGKAALAHWRHRAREVIGSVTVVVTTSTSIVRTPHYVQNPDSPAGAQGYRSVDALRREPEIARRAVAMALEVAAGHVRRAVDLAEPLGMRAEIDGLLDRIVGVVRVVRKDEAA